MKFLFPFLIVFVPCLVHSQNPPKNSVEKKGFWLRADLFGMIPHKNTMFDFGWEHRGFFPGQSVVWSAGIGWYNWYNSGPIAHIQTDELKLKKMVAFEYRQYLFERKNRTGPFMGIQVQGVSVRLHTRMRDTVFPQMGYFFDTTTYYQQMTSQIRVGYKWMSPNKLWTFEPSIGLGIGDQIVGESLVELPFFAFPNTINRFRFCISRTF